MSKIHESESIQDQKADEIDVILAELTLRSNGLPVGSLPSGAKVLIPSLDMQNAKQQLLALKERWEREASIQTCNDIKKLSFNAVVRNGDIDKYKDRIAQLGGKE